MQPQWRTWISSVVVLVALVRPTAAAAPADTPPAPPTSTTRPAVAAASQPVLRSLDEILRTLNPTDDQRAIIRSVMAAARQERRAWWDARGEEVQRLEQQIIAATDAKDAVALTDLRRRWQTAMKSAPSAAAAWEKIKASFAADQQDALAILDRDARSAVARDLHKVVRLQEQGATGSAACYPCHMPRKYLIDDH